MPLWGLVCAIIGLLGTVYNYSRNVFPTQYSLQISKGCISLALVPASISQIRLQSSKDALFYCSCSSIKYRQSSKRCALPAQLIRSSVYQVWLQQSSEGFFLLWLVQLSVYQIRYTQASMGWGFPAPLVQFTVYRVQLQFFELFVYSSLAYERSTST